MKPYSILSSKQIVGSWWKIKKSCWNAVENRRSSPNICISQRNKHKYIGERCLGTFLNLPPIKSYRLSLKHKTLAPRLYIYLYTPVPFLLKKMLQCKSVPKVRSYLCRAYLLIWIDRTKR
nr:uncharacterized protein LOC107430156 isoform X3 [Ziziphus jujuba var. spinosa]